MNQNMTYQMYDSSLLLGALLRISGLTIMDIQNILNGTVILNSNPQEVRNFILENYSFPSTLLARLYEKNINLDIINCMGIQSIPIETLKNLLYNPGEFPNNIDFSFKSNLELRKKMIINLHEKGKTQEDIAYILNLSTTTVNNFLRNYKNK